MKRFVAVALLLALVFALVALWIAPPHFFVVSAGSKAIAASLAVGDAKPRSARVISGFAVATTDVIESAAVLTIAFADGSKRECRFGYFTHSEFEPHYLSIDQCDDRWH